MERRQDAPCKPLLHLGQPPAGSKAAIIKRFIDAELAKFAECLDNDIRAFVLANGLNPVEIEWAPRVDLIVRDGAEDAWAEERR